MFRLLTAKLSSRVLVNDTSRTFATRAEFYNILTTYLKIDSDTAKVLAKQDPCRLRSTKRDQIIRNCLLCLEHQIEMSNVDCIPRCLLIQDSTLENRIFLLQDMGVPNVSIDQIAMLSFNVKLQGKKFKKVYGLPHDCNILFNILSAAGRVSNFPNMGRFTDCHKISDQYTVAMMYFKMYILPEEYIDIVDYRDTMRNRFKSLRLILQLLNFLHIELGFEPEFIQAHRYLLHISITNARNIIKGLKDVCIDDMSFKEVLKIWPRILACDLNNIKKLLELFKEYEIPKGAVSKCFNILNLDSAIFIERMTKIRKTKILSTWCTHNRILYIVFHYGLICDRVEILLASRIEHYAKSDVLLSFGSFFANVLHSDVHVCTQKYFRTFMKTEFGTTDKKILEALTKHVHWKAIGLKEMQDTLHYLKEHYTCEDICKCIQIILYPRSKLEKVLNYLYQQCTPQNGYSMTPSRYLSLCVYMLERGNNFSGDGVWRVKDEKKLPRLLDSTVRISSVKKIDIERLKNAVDSNNRSKYVLESDAVRSKDTNVNKSSPKDTVDGENIGHDVTPSSNVHNVNTAGGNPMKESVNIRSRKLILRL